MLLSILDIDRFCNWIWTVENIIEEVTVAEHNVFVANHSQILENLPHNVLIITDDILEKYVLRLLRIIKLRL